MSILTTRLTRLGARLRPTRADAERGTTMVEVVVAMTIMVICGAVFTSAVFTLSRTSNAAQAVNDATAQNNQAFQRLDKTVRYAEAISTPGIGLDNNWYVELRDTTGGSEVCTQLRVDRVTSQLQSRTWTSSSPVSTLSAWTPLASNVTNGAAAANTNLQPFVPGNKTAAPAGATATPTSQPSQVATAVHQQLTVTVVSAAGPAAERYSSTSSYVLTSLNSIVPAPSGPICQQVPRK